MNWMTCGIIKSFLTQDLKYDVINEIPAKKIWETLANKYMIKSVENLAFEEEILLFSVEKRNLH